MFSCWNLGQFFVNTKILLKFWGTDWRQMNDRTKSPQAVFSAKNKLGCEEFA